MLLAMAASLGANCCRFEVDSLKADLLEMKELVGLLVETPALDGFISGALDGDAEVIKAALQDAVACVAAAKDVLTDEQIVAYANKLEAYWAELGEARAPRPPLIDPAEGQLAPNELTYFPRDVFIARNLEVGGDATIDGNLTVEGDVNINTSNVSFIDNTNAASFNCLDFKKSRAGNIVQNGDSIGCLNFQGFDGSNFVSGALIEAHVDGAPGASDMPGRIVFLTSPDGTAVPTEKMRVNNAGVVSLTNNLDVPNTTNAATGVITKAGTRFIHNFGVENVFAGVSAGNFSLAGANQNTGVGFLALSALTTGDFNTGIGTRALRDLTSGGGNTAVGGNALLFNLIGINNTALGASALQNLVTGDSNTAVGAFAGNPPLATATQCTFLGSAASATADGFTNSTAIGFNAQVDASNKVRIGNASITVIEGQVAYTHPSDERIKKNIQESPLGLSFISRIKPILYEKECGENCVTEFGFSAQNVSEVSKSLGVDFPGVSYSESTDMYYMRYNDLFAPIVKSVQELVAEVESLKARVSALEARQ